MESDNRVSLGQTVYDATTNVVRMKNQSHLITGTFGASADAPPFAGSLS